MKGKELFINTLRVESKKIKDDSCSHPDGNFPLSSFNSQLEELREENRCLTAEVAELSSGKSAVNTPIEYIIADIEARDEAARVKEAAWRERCAVIKDSEDRPKRPEGIAVQVLAADMTNAAFVQRLADAEGDIRCPRG